MNRSLVTSLAALTLMAAPAGADEERQIALSELPAVVVAAAERAVPGIRVTEAERVTAGGRLRYEVEGRARGQDWELMISPEGKVLAIRRDD